MYNIYLVTYQEYNKEKPQNTIVAVDEIVDSISPSICKQIYENKYPNEKYQGELSIITMQKLYNTNKLEHPFLVINGN